MRVMSEAEKITELDGTPHQYSLTHQARVLREEIHPLAKKDPNTLNQEEIRKLATLTRKLRQIEDTRFKPSVTSYGVFRDATLLIERDEIPDWADSTESPLTGGGHQHRSLDSDKSIID